MALKGCSACLAFVGPKSFSNLRAALRNADALWLHDTLYPGNIFAFYAARRLKKPVVITQHIAPIPYKTRFYAGP
jgi:hypothetical protein